MDRPFIITVTASHSITTPACVFNVLDREAAPLLCEGRDLLFRLGDASGGDHSVLLWARERGLARRIFFADRKGYEFWLQSAPLLGYEPELESAVLCSDWDDPRDGNHAGHIRNSAMIGALSPEYHPLADLCVAIWDGSSPGTRHCMAQARNARVPIHQHGGSGPIEFRTPSPYDSALVKWSPLCPTEEPSPTK